MEESGIVFDIQRFAVHDGPGIRTTVFFKGCTCRCVWCHNPESLSVKPELELYPSRCIGCGKCFSICPQKCHSLDDGVHHINRAMCTGCGVCAGECYSNALVLKGKRVSLSDLMTSILSDRAYYEESGGGVTLSGGEPVLQNTFVAALLSACKAEGLCTALQTAGNYPFAMLEPLLPSLDMIMYDLKGFSPDIYTGYIRGNRELMLGNLEKIARNFKGALVVRTPCVGSINDTWEEIGSIVRFAAGLGSLAYYQLIPYHSLAKAKYNALETQFAGHLYTPGIDTIKAFEKSAAAFVTVFNQDKGYIEKEI